MAEVSRVVPQAARRVSARHRHGAGGYEETVSRWLARAREAGPEGLRAQSRPGRPTKLTASQLRMVPEFLWHGAEAYGFRGDVWTCTRIARVIEEEVGVHYHKSQVSRLRKKLQWTPQVPIRRAIQRDEQAIQRWRARRPSIRSSRQYYTSAEATIGIGFALGKAVFLPS